MRDQALLEVLSLDADLMGQLDSTIAAAADCLAELLGATRARC